MQPRPTLPIQLLSLATVVGATAAMALLLLPFTDSFINHTKLYLLLGTGLLVAILYLVRAIKRNGLDIVLTPFTAPLLILGGASLLSSVFTNNYPVENLLGMGGAYIAMVLIAVLGSSLLPKHSAKTYLSAFGLVGIALFAVTLLQFVGLGPAQWLNALMGLNIPGGLVFNLAGSTLIAFQLSLVALIGIAGYYFTTRKLPTLMMAAAPVLLIALLVFGWSMLPGKDTSVVLPSLSASWSVALDAIRSPRIALIGVGPEGYSNAYSQFKPLWVNMQDYWNINFNQASNVPLTLLTTMGFVGLAAWLFFAYSTLRMIKKVNRENLPLAWMAAAMVLLQLFMPANTVMLAILGITLAVLGAAERHKLPILQLQALSAKVTNQKKSEEMAAAQVQQARTITPFNFVAVLLLLVMVFLTFLVGRTYAAHVYMYESNRAALNDEVVKTYELQQAAVRMNPYLDTFRRRYAMTNMLIAVALSNKADANDQDKQQVSELIMQSVREARAATLLDPGDSQNWLTLAQIYEQMIGANEEAEQWAIQSYVAAIETNPLDPNIRIALGGIFLDQENWNEAANIFNSAVDIKPDFPNSYYNLGIALEQLGEYAAARAAYQQVLALLDPDTQDYSKVTEKLEAIEKLVEEADEAQQQAGAEEETGLTPSLLQQNLESQQDVISNPGAVELEGAEDIQPADTDAAPSTTTGPEAGTEATSGGVPAN